MRKRFIEYLKNSIGSIYVWGGQGESDISEAFIRKMENTPENADRAIRFWNKRICEGGKNLRAYDCSGLIVRYMIDNGIKPLGWDSTANGLLGISQKIAYSDIDAGDLLFRVSNGNAYHVGIYVGDSAVIHAKGRDVGVVEEHICANGTNYWNKYGRIKELKDVINVQKKLIISSPLKRGDDIKALQEALNALGYDCGEADGICGNKTIKAVSDFCALQGSSEAPGKLNITVKSGADTYTGEIARQ
ncbi:MAG: NlpC/P60 family protein [Clostridia bacterium]